MSESTLLKKSKSATYTLVLYLLQHQKQLFEISRKFAIKSHKFTASRMHKPQTFGVQRLPWKIVVVIFMGCELMKNGTVTFNERQYDLDTIKQIAVLKQKYPHHNDAKALYVSIV